MTAICKTILIHGDNLQDLFDYGADPDKTSVSQNGLQSALDYAANPLKTLAGLDDGDQDLLVSGILCQPDSAALDFGITREMYLANNGMERYASFAYPDPKTDSIRDISKKPVTAVHLIQSFGEPCLDPRVVHQIGLDLCERLGVQAVVNTHMDRMHLHNHIIINAYRPDGKTKFCMDQAMRMKLRELSDDIQRDYGIELTLHTPEKQLYQSRGRHSYREWEAKRQGCSWKEQMKEEIAAARSVSDNKEEFIEIMEDYGYTIARQEKDSIIWWNKAHTRKIRDKTLGDSYAVGEMFADAPDAGIPTGTTKGSESPKQAYISLARYDWNGRKRSSLELLICKAILLIRHMGRHCHSPSTAASYNAAKKLEIMEEALHTIHSMDLEEAADVKIRLDQIGASLSHVKSELQKLEGTHALYVHASALLSSYEQTRQNVAAVRFWPKGVMPDFMLPSFTKQEVNRNLAALLPMDGRQKRELYLILQKHPEYTLVGKDFSEISAIEAEEVFAFFRNARQAQPDCITKSEEAAIDRIYKKRNQHLKQTLRKPATPGQKKELAALLSAHGVQADMENLTQYDAVNIKNCYGPNPFGGPLIGPAQQEKLSSLIQGSGYSLNRDVQYVQVPEYEELINYLAGFTRRMPALLRDGVPISPENQEKLTQVLKTKGIDPAIPISAMTNADFKRMYGYALGQGHVPDCIVRPAHTAQEFLDHLPENAGTKAKQLLCMQLRNQAAELLSLGIDPEHGREYLSSLQAAEDAYTELESQKSVLSQEYKTMLRLQQQLAYAESPSFLYGPHFNEKPHKVPSIREIDLSEPPSQRDTGPDL